MRSLAGSVTRRSGPQVAPEAAESIATDTGIIARGGDIPEQIRARALATNVRTGCGSIRHTMKRGDLTHDQVRDEVLTVVSALEVSAVRWSQ